MCASAQKTLSALAASREDLPGEGAEAVVVIVFIVFLFFRFFFRFSLSSGVLRSCVVIEAKITAGTRVCVAHGA